jgi:phosphatidylserine/phosphatidylglycerophosphate/cardiolipin synthase-like enzyme
LNFEVGALVRDAEFVAEARRQFEQDLKASHALNLDEVLSRGRQSSLL